MQTIIQNKLSSMLDELLQKALEEKPKKINKGNNIYCGIFWKNIEILYYNYNVFYPTIRIVIPNSSSCDYGDVTIKYNNGYSEYQKELIKQIFEKWGNDNELQK